MRYEIKGKPLPVVECYLEAGESMQCDGGAMSWMSPNMKMETLGGGIGGVFSKAFSGQKMFSNKYTAEGKEGMIGFASNFPGDILAVELHDGKDIVCQKSIYLAATEGIKRSIFFQKKLGAGFFGGEGFIMQRMTGEGTIFLKVDGSTVTKELAAGEQIVVDTGHVAIIDSSCSIDIVTVKGVKNVFLGGEGLFNTVVTGPGRVILQTMPICQLANTLGAYTISVSD